MDFYLTHNFVLTRCTDSSWLPSCYGRQSRIIRYTTPSDFSTWADSNSNTVLLYSCQQSVQECSNTSCNNILRKDYTAYNVRGPNQLLVTTSEISFNFEKHTIRREEMKTSKEDSERRCLKTCYLKNITIKLPHSGAYFESFLHFYHRDVARHCHNFSIIITLVIITIIVSCYIHITTSILVLR